MVMSLRRIGVPLGGVLGSLQLPALVHVGWRVAPTHLTRVVGFDLVGAGRALALYQITGAASRPIWGWIADRWIAPGQTRAVHGFGMAAAAVAAGAFGPHWNRAAVLAAVSLAGCPPAATPASPPSRWHAAQRGHRLGTAVMFAGVLLIPPCFGLGVAASGSHAPAYCVPAALASASAVLLCLDRWTRRAAAPA